MFAVNEIAALTACIFLPGSILICLVRPRIPLFGAIAMAVGLSLTFNHLLVAILATVKAYSKPLLVSAIAGQIVGLLVLVLRDAKWRDKDLRKSPFEATRLWQGDGGGIILLIAFTLPVFGAAFIQYASVAWRDFGHAFGGWDPIVSWNRWALVWSEGRIPIDVWEYPQLLPTTWSMIYKLTGAPQIELFAKALCAWIPILSFICFADMVQRKDQVGGTCSAVAAGLLLLIASPFQLLGYADVPSGTLAFVGFYTALQSIKLSGRDAYKSIFLGCIIVAGGALTKQSGVLFAIALPISLWILSPSHDGRLARVIMASAVLIAAISPWYVYRAIQEIFYGAGTAIVQTAIRSHAGQTMWQRVHIAGTYLQPFMTMRQAGYFIIPGLLLAPISRLGRVVLLTAVIPYLIIFLVFFGYDEHNALPVIPFVAWAVGIGFSNAARLLARHLGPTFRDGAWGLNRISINPTWRIPPSLAMLMAACIFTLVQSLSVYSWAGGTWPSFEKLYDDQRKMAMEHGNPEINKRVVSLFDEPSARGKILTSYLILLSFDRVRPFLVPNSFEDKEYLDNLITQGNIEYILDDMTGSQAVTADLESRRLAGEFRLLASGPKWRLLATVPKQKSATEQQPK